MIAYLILNYNSSSDMKECISSIQKYCNNYRIVVVDNGSDESDAARAKEICDKSGAIFIASKENLGFAKGNNLGFSYIRENFKCDFIAMINSDTVLLDNTFEIKLCEAFEKYHFAVLGPDILPSHSNPMIDELDSVHKVKKRINYIKMSQFILSIPVLNMAYLAFGKINNYILPKNRKNKIPNEHDIINCQLHGCFLVFSNLYMENGICGETFLYGEEDILARQCKDKGYTMLYYPEIKIQHNESRATKNSIPNVIKRRKFYYKHRLNSLYVLLKCFEEKKIKRQSRKTGI